MNRTTEYHLARAKTHGTLVTIDGADYDVLWRYIPAEPDVGINGGVCVEALSNCYTGAQENTDGRLAELAAEIIAAELTDPGL